MENLFFTFPAFERGRSSRDLGETKLGRKEIDDFLSAVCLSSSVTGTGYYTQSSKTNIRTTTTTSPPIVVLFLAPSRRLVDVPAATPPPVAQRGELDAAKRALIDYPLSRFSDFFLLIRPGIAVEKPTSN